MSGTPHSTVLALCATLIATGCAPAGPHSLSQADQDAIRQIEQEGSKAIRDRNFAAWTALFTDGGELLPPNGAAIEGRAAIKAWADAFPPYSGFEATTVSVEGSGDLAYARGNYTMTFETPGQPDHGKYLEIYRKQADGTWKLTHDIFNSDVPLPVPAAKS